jgi:hypothetical protein
MALATTHFTDGGVKNSSSGSRTGTRVAADFEIVLGFSPRRIKVTNLTDRVSAEWFAESPASSQLKTVAAGTRTYEDCGVALNDEGNGFTVDVSVAGLETDDDDVVWEAHD